ncbi:hypothetical protein [Finegoldia magna]|uniref:Uncharacterized protein n=1 Tax=Finegoldia magna TaxID=1260 RepID=A0A6N3BU76_FINMA|nr:hypothetical protein [Finegoldia magna]MDU1832242.1 hypothetical protein [Finegoldia magna]MDU1878501.1 hypothetical protein [Finegoldia magna]MDU5201531.1 hypothetical protein [Finegoldia magna]MDU6776486.1 hypothetical protein [Finegoldia magna]
MLIDPSSFKRLEDSLIEQGKIEKFEKESGKILGRVMITIGSIPDDIKEDVLRDNEEDDLIIFNCSFDFYNSTLGIALYKKDFKLASRIWITEQEEGAEKPSQDWIEFFIRLLVEYVIESNDGFGYPIYAFINNDSEMVIVPE